MNSIVKFAPQRPRYLNFDPLLDYVCSLDYLKCRQYLAHKVQPKYPRFNYKYMPVSTSDSGNRIKYLRDILIESSLWLSSPIAFNDPFDMTAKVIFEGSTNQLRERFKKIIAENSVGKWKERNRLLNEFMAKPRTEWQVITERIFKTNIENTGVFSFAGDPRSILMWSHYADNHTGICLQFEVAKNPKTMLEAMPMKYVDDYPIFNWADDTGTQLTNIILSKFKKWDYEKESRITWHEGANTYLPFDSKALVGVIFGCRVENKVVDIVNNILDEREKKGMPNVKIYKAQKHSSEYKLVINRA